MGADTKTGLNAATKTATKKATQKAAEARSEFIGNKSLVKLEIENRHLNQIQQIFKK